MIAKVAFSEIFRHLIKGWGKISKNLDFTHQELIPGMQNKEFSEWLFNGLPGRITEVETYEL